MRLHSILNEATTSWMGPLRVLLGSGEPYTLNYGTGDPSRPPMLYVPIPMSYLRRTIRQLSRQPLQYLERDPGRLTHVGEAHATISMGPELKPFAQDYAQQFRQAGLFDQSGAGVAVSVRHTGQFKILNAMFYQDDADPRGPQLVAELVQIPQLQSIRTALGLSPLPQIPGIDRYLPHITIGYSARRNLIHRSYVAAHGSQPRSRASAGIA